MITISNHDYLTQIKHLVAIGGGHGLGRVMSSLSFLKEQLTGIVATTDNGGSTGRIRHDHGGIAWGDLRNCLTQIIANPTTASAVFEYRFSGSGELAGHNLGNLILKALEDMHIRPTDAINLIRNFLRVKSYLLPMSDSPVHLGAILPSGEKILGEVAVDNLQRLPTSLFLYPIVQASPEAVNAILQAEVILLGPGSFLTSIMPTLLLPEIMQALKTSSAKIIFIDNLGVEHSPAARLSLADRIGWINKTVGKNIVDGAITSMPIEDQQALDIKLLVRKLNADDVTYRHDRDRLCSAINEMIAELF
ncbi:MULTISPECIES: gluconeogenesis factor YvcK family protein [unclassified Lonepinella]|uniref:gluconeogenesis factor YvcK family protein n=1 Tax=unclassified Lonepinella TaxID=2642006 RepID=UPI0036DF6E96